VCSSDLTGPRGCPGPWGARRKQRRSGLDRRGAGVPVGAAIDLGANKEHARQAGELRRYLKTPIARRMAIRTTAPTREMIQFARVPAAV